MQHNITKVKSISIKVFYQNINRSSQSLLLSIMWSMLAIGMLLGCSHLHKCQVKDSVHEQKDIDKPNINEPIVPTVGSSSNLHEAARDGHVDLVDLYLSQGAEVDGIDQDGNSPLYLAAKHSHLPVVDLLIKKGADVNATNRDGNTALHMAAYKNNPAIANMLLANSANPNAIGHTTLPMTAAHENNPAIANMVLALLTNSANPNATYQVGFTPLLMAAQHATSEMINLLINNGAIVNVTLNDDTNIRTTPLHAAIKNGKIDVAERLVAHGALVDARGMFEYTPLHYAMIKILDQTASQKDDWSGVDFTSMRLLCDNGANVNCRDNDGNTPLHLLALCKNILPGPITYEQVVNFLVQRGADENAINNRGLTYRQIDYELTKKSIHD